MPTHHLVWSRRSASPRPVSTSRLRLGEPSRLERITRILRDRTSRACRSPYRVGSASALVRATRRNDDCPVASVEIGAFDRAVVHRRAGAHVGPVDVTGGDVDRDAIRKATLCDKHLWSDPSGLMDRISVTELGTTVDQPGFAAGFGF